MEKLVMPLAHTVFLPRQAAPMAQIKTVSLATRLLKITEESGKVICSGNIEVHVAYYPFLPGSSNSIMDKVILIPFRTECPGALPACSLNDCTTEIRDVTWQLISSHAFEIKANFYLMCDLKMTVEPAKTVQSADIVDGIECEKRTALGSVIDCGVYEPILEEFRSKLGAIECLPEEEEKEYEAVLPPQGYSEDSSEVEKEEIAVVPPSGNYPLIEDNVQEETVIVSPPMAEPCIPQIVVVTPCPDESEPAEPILDVTEEQNEMDIEEVEEVVLDAETEVSALVTSETAATVVTYTAPCAKRETVGNQYCLKFYLVQSGEDLAAVAEKHDISKEELEDANKMTEEDICTGMILNIPE